MYKGNIMQQTLSDVGKSIAKGVQNSSTHSARAAATANGVSAASQAAQGQFNQNSVNNANAIGSNRLMDQYQFNAGQAAMANNFTQASWEQAAAWNEMMWERQAEFNAAEAEKQRAWSERMEKTRYQRAMKDMQKAGLNPILAYGGIQTGAGSANAASVGGASMSSAQGQAASGGMVNGLAASEGNYSGQMEYMSGMLGLFGAAIDGISTAMNAWAQMDSKSQLGQILEGMIDGLMHPKEFKNNVRNKINKFTPFK